MPWPSLSIIVTSLNRASFIQRTLLSILRQDYAGKVEVIVADGGSTDGTVEVLKRYSQVTWWSERDGGIVDAINKGLAQATGEFVAIQDSDNYYLRDAFKLTLTAATAYALPLVAARLSPSVSAPGRERRRRGRGAPVPRK